MIRSRREIESSPFRRYRLKRRPLLALLNPTKSPYAVKGIVDAWKSIARVKR